MGLFALGVWLSPSELEMLLTTLDEDGGGTIDFSEFESFWNSTSFDKQKSNATNKFWTAEAARPVYSSGSTTRL